MLSIIFDEFKIVEEVGENLGVCVMNIFPKVSSLPSLLASINLMKMEIWIF